jgi:hypothetical protein
MEASVDIVSEPAGRARGILRSAGVGVLSLGLGVAAHALSGGALPSIPILCGLTALAVLASALLAQARLPGWAVMLMLGASQQALHWLLGGLGGAASSTVPGTGSHHGGAVPGGPDGAPGHSPEVMLMLHTHLAVALLIGWAVVRHPDIGRWLSRRDSRRQHLLREKEGAPVV